MNEKYIQYDKYKNNQKMNTVKIEDSTFILPEQF